MQITDLSIQKNNPKKLNLFVDGVFFSGVSPKIVLENKLSPGMKIEVAFLEEIAKKIIEENLTGDALNYISYRPRSKTEVKNHLLSKSAKDKINLKKFGIGIGWDPVIDGIIKKLTDLGYLDDKKFIAWWFSQRQSFNQKSQFVIKKELMQKGVDENLIKEVLCESNNDINNDLENAKKLLSKKIDRWSALDKFEKKKKIINYLGQRGFSYDTIEKAIDSLGQKD